VPVHCRMRAFDRDLIRGGHYGQRSCEPRKQAEHMAAPTNPANVKKALANSEPSTHGTRRPTTRPARMSGVEGQSGNLVLNLSFTGSDPLQTLIASLNVTEILHCSSLRAARLVCYPSGTEGMGDRVEDMSLLPLDKSPNAISRILHVIPPTWTVN
jgi:hypothetical protein